MEDCCRNLAEQKELHYHHDQWKSVTQLFVNLDPLIDSLHNDPALGRFISADTIVGRPTWPQALNRYSYTFNNPLRLIDPSGNEPEDRPEHESPEKPDHSDNTVGHEDTSSGQEKDTIESNFTNGGETNSDGLAQLDNQITKGPAPEVGSPSDKQNSTDNKLTKDKVETNLQIMKDSPWGKGEGYYIEQRLNEMYKDGRIFIGETSRENAFAEFNKGTSEKQDYIMLNEHKILSEDQWDLRLGGHLAHEGYHAVHEDEGFTVNQEFRAFQSEYHFELSVGYSFAEEHKLSMEQIQDLVRQNKIDH